MSTPSILLVDDNQNNLYQLEVLLGANGYQIVSAVNGADALAKARQNPPNLIVTDILMPVMDGFSLCREWRQDPRLCQIPLIFYTATYTDDRDREFALSLGAAQFLVKPEEPDVLLGVIRDVLGGTMPAARVSPGPESSTPVRIHIEAPTEEKEAYLQQYNETLIRKLEAKMQQLEHTRRELERDIAERKETERHLREAETRYRALFEQSPDGIVIIEPETTQPLEFNEAVHRQLGYSREEFARLRLSDIEAEQSQEGIRQRIAGVLRGGRTDFETCQRTKQGDIRNVLVTAQVIQVLGRPVYHCIWRDITEHKKLEAQVLRAQRMEGIGALASGIAHDLNNILAPILMIAPLLRETAPDDDSRSLLTTIETSAQRGADIIKQLLLFARGTPGTRAPLPLGHLLRDMDKIMRETFPRDLHPVVDYSPKTLWPVLGDATQLHQFLMNLCVNARDAMPEGGTLTIAAKNVRLDEAFTAMAPNARPGAYVCVSVSDTGTGIAPEHLDRIFDPFFTTKEIGRGTGLGLATVLGIVRGHGGFIQVNSQLGAGTTFQLYLPAAPETQVVNRPVRQVPPPRGQGELILVVDDEAAVRECLRRTLECHGYRVLAATQGSEGLAVFSQHSEAIHAVVADMMMPVMNGPVMVAELRRLDPRLVIVGMTGLPERSGVKGFENLELPAVLTKPFSGEELLQTLHTALQTSRRTTNQ